MSAKLNVAIDILNRMNPKNIKDDMFRLIELLPELSTQILENVQLPLEIEQDTSSNFPFIKCDFNRFEDSWRSPFSNDYFPNHVSGPKPEGKERELELALNDLLKTYCHKYYTSQALSSAFVSSNDKDGYNIVIAISKINEDISFINKAIWNSIHFLRVNKLENEEFEYDLTSTIILDVNITNETSGKTNVGGSFVTTEKRTVQPAKGNHIPSIGQFILDVESVIAQRINTLYFDRTAELAMRLHRKEMKIAVDPNVAMFKEAFHMRLKKQNKQE
eukprot:TRINITY_DN2936_c0_g1_i1.p1 TRINITY_DN2936_c0_g1~~TRINITY_DN2936_c0_g1_i1.p1  ORF type:complete len:284 (+),score=80.82 TRINITY_DN2936_c0_g1_i1:30-854(+)